MNYVTVLSKDYEVRFKDDVDMHSNAGAVHVDKGIIDINNDHSPDCQEDSLVHEIIHILDRELVLNLEEDQVRRLATGLYSAGLKAVLLEKE